MDRIPPLHIFVMFLRLGLTSFGGPIAHLGYFHRALVIRRRWLDEESYAELVALCQFLPGPSSSQVAMGIGLAKAGWAGAVAAWLGFALPSAVLMTVLGLSMRYFGTSVPGSLLHSLMLVAVPVVAQAVWMMARQLCPDWPRRLIAIAVAALLIEVPAPLMQPLVILIGGVVGATVLADRGANEPHNQPPALHRRLAPALLTIFFMLLLLLPPASLALSSHALSVFSAFYRTGALVFGGGHVILPLLQSSVVPTGWVNLDGFLAGYGAAQAMPGPLFSFAAYLGAIMTSSPNGIGGALLCLTAIYLPSFLLVIGTLPIWQSVRHIQRIRGFLKGINVVVVGLLGAALYNPVWTSVINTTDDIIISAIGFVLLTSFEMPSWVVVILIVMAAGVTSV